MSQNLNYRLEQLEKEIYGLLRLQQQQCTDIQNLIPIGPGCEIRPCVCNKKKHNNNHNSQRVHSGSEVERLDKKTACLKSCNKTKSSTAAVNGTPQIKSVICYSQIEPKYDTFEISKYRNSACQFSRTKFQTIVEQDKEDEAEKVIVGLKEELSYSKTRMCTMAKDMALLTDALQSLRTKYKNIKSFRKDAAQQIQELKSINYSLCRKLEEEMQNQAETVKSIKEQEALKLGLKVKEEVCKYFKKCRGRSKQLQESNEKLNQNLQELNNKYEEARNEIEELKNELRKQEDTSTIKCRITDDLEDLLKKEKQKNAVICKTIEKLEKSVQNLMKTEKKYQQEIELLKSQISKLENVNKEYRENLNEENKLVRELQSENNGLKKQICDVQADSSVKMKKLEEDMEKIKLQTKEKEKLIMEEKNTLKELVQELSEVVKKHKNRIKQLVQINRQQEGMLRSQMIALHNKEEELKKTETHLLSTNHKNSKLEEQIQHLRQSVNSMEKMSRESKEKVFDCKEKLKLLEKDLQNARHSIQEEQDKLLIKEKIIEDQADTIKKLKNSVGHHGDEIKLHSVEVAKLHKELEDEKLEKSQLKETIDDIQWHKQQLQEQIVELEDALKEKSQLPEKIDQHKKLLLSLEHQVCMKQKEWELRCKLLSTEKKKAVQAAKFATQKLVDTVNDFQSHAESQKQVQAMLTNMVQCKNQELKCACQKISEFKDLMKQHKMSSTSATNIMDGSTISLDY